MFTGLVEAVGELVERKTTSGGFRLRIGSTLAPELAPGDSLAVNGVCLTVILAEENEIHADSRFGGHFVQGHVDAIGHVEEFRQDAEFHWLTVSFPSHLAPYIIHKGSIAVDGVSLTVAGLGADRFDVQVVPYTMDHTNLRRAAIRDRVNIECDMIGKYVIRAAELAGLTLTRALPGETTH
jgi:riboflavin synthase